MGEFFMIDMQPYLSARRREDLASIFLGILAAIAAISLHPAVDAIVINAVATGLVIVALAALEITVPPRWEEPFEILAGAWLAISPFWLGYGDTLRTFHIVIGALVVILAAVELWQDREDIEASR
jgi:SPW repeat